MICSVDHVTGFYMMATLAFNGLINWPNSLNARNEIWRRSLILKANSHPQTQVHAEFINSERVVFNNK